MKKGWKIAIIVIGSIIALPFLFYLYIYITDPFLASHMGWSCTFPPGWCIVPTNISCGSNPNCILERGSETQCNEYTQMCEYIFEPHTISKRECLDMNGEWVKMGCT